MASHSGRAGGRSAPVPPAEALEQRRLLSGTLIVAGTANADTITVGVNASGGIHVVLNNVATDYAAGAYSALQVNSGAGSDAINVQATVVPTTISSTGGATVTVANSAGGLTGVAASLAITNASPLTHLVLDDSSDAHVRTVALGTGSAGFGQVSGLSPAAINFRASGTADLLFKSFGLIGNLVNVTDVVVPTRIQAQPVEAFGVTAYDHVNVGAAAGLQGILQPLTLSGGIEMIDDSGDASARQVAVNPASSGFYAIHGIAPADITALVVSLKLPTVGGSTVNVNGCGTATQFFSNTGTRPRDTIRIGDGTMTNVRFPIYVHNSSGSDDLILDNSLAPPGSTVSFGTAQIGQGPGLELQEPSGFAILDNSGGGGSVTCLGDSKFEVEDLSPLPTATLDLNFGMPGGIADVWNVPASAAVNLIGHGGNLQVQTHFAAGPGPLGATLAGPLSISNDGGSVALTVDDSNDPNPRTVVADTFTPAGSTHTWGRVTGLAPGLVSYDATSALVTLTGGSGGDTWQFLSTPPRPAASTQPDLVINAHGADSLSISGTGAHANVHITHAPKSSGSPDSNDTIDFSAGRISDGTSIDISGTNAAALTVRGASSDDPFNGAPGVVQHGATLITYRQVNSVHLRGGTFRDVTWSAVGVEGSDAILLLSSAYNEITALTLNGGKALLGGSNQTQSLTALSIMNGGELDLANDRLRVSYAVGVDAVAAMSPLVRSGYNNGGWNGPGIVSGTLDSQHGLTVTPVSANVALVQPARYGDANLDGRVNFTDLLKLAQNYGQTNASWTQGDFDYDTSVDFSDLLKLAQNYGALGAVAVVASPPAPSAELPTRRRPRNG